MWVSTSCEQQNTYVEPPPPTVTVAQPVQEEVVDYLEFTGTTRAFMSVEVRARVAGFLESMHFTPGTMVEQDQLLFVIDPREYQARLDAARAELDSANAQLRRAQTELARAEKLFKQQAGSDKSVVQWRGDRDIALAAVAEAQAKVERAALDLSFTQVTAPIAGRVGRNMVDVGNLVGEGEATLLTTIDQMDPIYAYFYLNERDLLKVMAMARKHERPLIEDEADTQGAAAQREIPVFLGVATEEGYPHEGALDFAESGVDSGTGTLELRGLFPNPGNMPSLLPGLFARIRMPIEKREGALLVTERAVGSDQGGPYVLVVTNENAVEKRPVRTGQLVDGLRVIEEGVRPGEKVIVNGLQRARPGAKVAPESGDMNSFRASVIRATAEGAKGTSSQKNPDARPDEGKEKSQ
jgi:RND family efflux transporter MFP subunit